MIYCTENYIFFFQTSCKDGHSKKIALEYDLSCIIDKDDFLPKNMILPPRRKMKDDLSQKNTRKYDIFFKCSQTMVFSKRTTPGHDLSCIVSKDSIFSPKAWYFFLGQKIRDGLSQEIHSGMIFSVYMHRCYGRGDLTLCQKKIKDDLILQKYTLEWLIS